MAPFFVLLEVIILGLSSMLGDKYFQWLHYLMFSWLIGSSQALQSLFGYEPYPGFHSKVKATIDAEIKEWQEKKQKKIS